MHHVIVCDPHLIRGERVLFQNGGSMGTVERAAHQAGWLTIGWPRIDLCPACAQTENTRDQDNPNPALRALRQLALRTLRRNRS